MSKQMIEESILTKKKSKTLQLHNCQITSFPRVVRASKQKQPTANVSYRWTPAPSYCCRNNLHPPNGYLKARVGSPCGDTVCCWGPFTLIWAERLPRTTRGKRRGRQRGRKYSGLTGVLGIKKTESHLWSESWFWQWCEIWLREKRRQRDTEGCLCRAHLLVYQGQKEECVAFLQRLWWENLFNSHISL